MGGGLVIGAGAYFSVLLANGVNTDLIVERDAVRIARVHRGDLVREVSAQGRIVVANSPTLSAPEAGHVTLDVKAGDAVAPGQRLATIESPELHELLAREKANLSRMHADLARQKIQTEQEQLALRQSLAMAEVQIKAMQREMRRADEAFTMAIISELDYETARDDLERARLVQQQASQALALAADSEGYYEESLILQTRSQDMLIQTLERRIAALTIVSPVKGMVGNIQVNQHQALTANQPLITVVDLTAYEIEAQVSESMAGDLAPTMDARVRMNGREYDGTLTAISPEVIQGQVAARIRFVGEVPPNLRQNQRLSARIFLEKKSDTLMLERGPAFDSFNGYLFTVQAERAVRTPVALGASSLRHVEIEDGLSEGDEVIISRLQTRDETDSILLTH